MFYMLSYIIVAAGAFGMVFDGRHDAHAAQLAFYGAGAFATLLGLSILTTRARLKRRRK